MDKNSNLVWIDLEMTGLDCKNNVILEIATIITDKDLNVIEQGPSLIINQAENTLKNMIPYVAQMHEKSGLTENVRTSKITLEDAEKQTLEFIKKYCNPQAAPLCGNSVWQDRIFLMRYMTQLDSYLHYRMIDVTSFKEVITRWYPKDPNSVFKKKDNHRALDDIKESIEELKHYRQSFFREN